MADDTPRRQSEDDPSSSPLLNSARVNRHGDRAYEIMYNGHRLSPISEPLDPEQQQTPSPPERPYVPNTQTFGIPPDSRMAASYEPSRSESESPDSVTSAQDPIETPIRSTHSFTDAWWANRRRGFYSQNQVKSTHDLNHGQHLHTSQGIDTYPKAGSSALPAGRSPALPAASATDADSRPTRELLPSHSDVTSRLSTFSTPSVYPVPGRARSDAFSTPNISPLPTRAHSAALSTPKISPPSAHRQESSSTAPATNADSKPRYQNLPSSSSVSLVPALHSNTCPSTPIVSPLSGQRPEPISSRPTIYTPPSGHRSSVTVPRSGNSSSTLFSNRFQQALLTGQQPEVQLERAESQTKLVPEQSVQPTIGDISASSTENGAQTGPARTVDKRLFLFPRYKFKPWESDEKPWEPKKDEGGVKRRNDMAGLDQDIALVPLVRFANSRIRTLKSSDDYRKWIQGGKKLRQTRGTEGLPANKSRPLTSEPQLLVTWERETPAFREKHARYRSGYKWSTHGVLNPRHGVPVPETGPGATNGSGNPQVGTGSQTTGVGVPQAHPWLGSSIVSSHSSILPDNPNLFVSGDDLQPSSSPNSGDPLIWDVRGTYDRSSVGRANGPVLNESDSLYENPSYNEHTTIPRIASTSVAPSSHCDHSVSHNNTVDHTSMQMLRGPQRSHAAGNLKASTLAKSQDRSDTSTNAKISANGDVLVSLNRRIERTSKEIRRRTLRHVQDGAFNGTLHDHSMREAVQEVSNLASQPSGCAVPYPCDTDSPNGCLSLESVPLTIFAQGRSVAAHHSTEAEHGTLTDWMRDRLVGASDALHLALERLAPTMKASDVAMQAIRGEALTSDTVKPIAHSSPAAKGILM